MLCDQNQSDSRLSKQASRLLLFMCAAFLFAPLARPVQHDMRARPEVEMNAPAAVEDVTSAAKRLADKQESEFNHHLAGLFVILAGILILSGRVVESDWSFPRYAWPVCFIAAGLFVLIFSDTEMWPFGPQNPWYAVTQNPRIFSTRSSQSFY